MKHKKKPTTHHNKQTNKKEQTSSEVCDIAQALTTTQRKNSHLFSSEGELKNNERCVFCVNRTKSEMYEQHERNFSIYVVRGKTSEKNVLWGKSIYVVFKGLRSEKEKYKLERGKRMFFGESLGSFSIYVVRRRPAKPEVTPCIAQNDLLPLKILVLEN